MSRCWRRGRCATAVDRCFIAALAHAAGQHRGGVTDRSAADHRARCCSTARWSAGGAGPPSRVGFFGALLVIKPLPSTFDIWAVSAPARRCLRRCAKSEPGIDAPCRPCDCVLRARSPSRIRTLFASEDGGLFELATWSAVRRLGVRRHRHLSDGALAPDVDLSVVAPFRYSYLITSAIGGFWCSANGPTAGRGRREPDRGQGIYLLHREAVRRRP